MRLLMKRLAAIATGTRNIIDVGALRIETLGTQEVSNFRTERCADEPELLVQIRMRFSGCEIMVAASAFRVEASGNRYRLNES